MEKENPTSSHNHETHAETHTDHGTHGEKASEHEAMDHSGHKKNTDHKAHVDHAGHEQMFRTRFWISLVLSILRPVAMALSKSPMNVHQLVSERPRYARPLLAPICFASHR